MPNYISTQQLSDRSGIGVPEIRALEEAGVLKAAPGRETYRKRWPSSAPGDLRRALRVYPQRGTIAHPFNAVLAPGALARAAKPAPQPLPPEETPMAPAPTKLDEALARFKARGAALTLSEKSAAQIAAAWLELRPGSKNDASAVAKVVERVNKQKARKQAPVSVRAYLLHLGLVERQPAGFRKGSRPRPWPVAERKPAPRPRPAQNGAAAPAASDIAGLGVADLETLLPLLKEIETAALASHQLAFLIAWLQQR